LVDSSSHACRQVASRQPLRRLCRCGNGSSGVCRLRLAQSRMVPSPPAQPSSADWRGQPRFRAGRACLGGGKCGSHRGGSPVRAGCWRNGPPGSAPASLCPCRCRLRSRQRHRPSAPPVPGGFANGTSGACRLRLAQFWPLPSLPPAHAPQGCEEGLTLSTPAYTIPSADPIAPLWRHNHTRK